MTVVNEDILKLDIDQIAREHNDGKPIKVVANLPYYITTPIIMGLFESHVPIDSITVMVQKEVADRMQSGPGTKDYGALSLAVQYYAKPEIVANVPPNCFMPRPKVGSAVIRLTRHAAPPVKVDNEKWMFDIIRASFNQRRKTLQNGIANSGELSFTKEEVAKALESLGISHCKGKYPSQMSGGEQQRVAIARAIVTHPAVIFADEPTGNLDAESAKIVADMLSMASKKYNQTIIMVTHDMQMADHADRVLTIVDGNVKEGKLY